MVSQFYYRPFLFFNEIGFHTYCYAVFYRNPVFAKLFTTRDGKNTNLIHPEYGSIKTKIGGKGRAWYDLVILNPRFVQDNDLERVANNYGTATSYKPDDLMAVLEFKYLRSSSKEYVRQLQKDYHSLSNAVEALNKYMIVFADVKSPFDYFSGMQWDDHTKLVYTVVDFSQIGRKQIKVLIKPDNFLKLPGQWLATV